MPQALVRFPSQRLLVPSATSDTSNDKGGNEMIPEAVHRSPGIHLMAEEKEEILSHRLVMAVRPVIASSGVPYSK
jgi:hypothetical protein